MKRQILHTLVALAAVSILASCQNGGDQNRPEPNITQEITLSGLSEDHWSYFSFETGELVGTSPFLSEKDDAEWSGRDDWDFAICGKYLKTNGGTSGTGAGGVLRDETHNFLTLDEAPSEGYLKDERQITR